MTKPIDLRPDHAAIVQEVLARHLPAGVSVRAFGSRAKWTAKTFSDLDIAVKGKEKLPYKVMVELADAFEESDLPFRVDVVDWHAVTPSFQAVIDRDGVALGWQIAPLEDCLESLIDYRGKSPTKSATGIPVLSAKVVKTTGLIRPIEQTIAPEYYPKWMTRGLPKPGDVVMTTEAPMGEVIQLDAETARYALGQRIVCMRGKRGHLDNTFLRYLLTSPKQQDILASYATGTTVLGISQKALRSMPISFPAIEEQERIGALLSALDDKIELNRQMNETLEGMAQAVFQDWFVDFGPVRRKAAGETDAVAIVGGLTPDTARAAQLAALFPDAFGDDGLPVGWSERPLDSIAEFLNGLALQKHPAKPGEPDLPVIKIAELRNGISDRTNRAARSLPSKYIIKDGDFIFSWSGSLMAKVWTEGDGALNQHLFKVSSDVYPQWFYALWVQHHMPEFQLIAASKATTMGHIQRGHLSSATTVCPQGGAMEVMSSVMQPLWDRMIHNELENRTLSETRDYLLPRLMSGTVRVTRESEAA